ncbi:TauD/TfdA dioxygenase family protein [Rhodopila sp.]|jgi:taurine dioxygenase|uniref:TauD/TfdA dioxygenase family protein n=1 Tax=Rhodopila sp. TaxID=2480087 RepID=UPI002C404847|nr:TauD/TfdA family dioxygenase [Rhodopila sp.]HVZ10552.1 TauD/TfdA family dioxygenase [Rhodopila sp.]
MNAPANTIYRHLTVEKIAGAGGAEISGVDLSKDVPQDVLAEIRAALLDNLVIVFRNQELTPDQQLAFARKWGEIHLHPFMQGMPDYPEILAIIKRPTDKKNFGGSWHTDQMFAPSPAMGTMLYAKQVPSAGGDTLFTNQYLAYESLSDGMKALAQKLRTVCVGDNFKQADGRSRKDRYADTMSEMKVKDPGNVQTTSVHPLVRTHPETGRKALYIGGHVQHFDGMTDEESQPLIDFFMKHSVRPEFTVRVRWQPGTLTFWDNRCTQHFAVNDYPAETRIMHRITICGDQPF